jgi:hypothetical protein
VLCFASGGGALRTFLKQSGSLKLSDEINRFSSPVNLFKAHGNPRIVIQIQLSGKIKRLFSLPKSLIYPFAVLLSDTGCTGKKKPAL